uniref:beta-N-acetylhexosaminidase n=1 Tax=Xenopus tropicalis TaxID=8364 RepID=A0A6I8SDM2_XENTR
MLPPPISMSPKYAIPSPTYCSSQFPAPMPSRSYPPGRSPGLPGLAHEGAEPPRRRCLVAIVTISPRSRSQGCGSAVGSGRLAGAISRAPSVGFQHGQVLPLFSALGATGLLIEYEDTFPYYGELLPLRAPHAYSPQEIREILRLAQSCQLEVIPLVQTFGHMEFVLKHKEFAHLREVEAFPNTLNPHKEQSLPLVQAMIGQVMELHPDARWLHVGSDEVYCLGEGNESKEIMANTQITVEEIFLHHLKSVTSHVASTFPGVRPIAWDDMIRAANEQALTESGVAPLVELMLWDYSPDLDVDNKVATVAKYKQSGFQKIWFASAFKGATGVREQLTSINHHLGNNSQWLKVAGKIPKELLQGIALTGWQRYDHFSVLCELLPVALPSVAVCLQFLKHGEYSDQVMEQVKSFLGMTELENLASKCSGSFPGSKVFSLITQLMCNLRPELNELLGENSLMSRWQTLHDELQNELLQIYPPSAVAEWMEVNVLPWYLQLKKLAEELNAALQNPL